MTYGLWDYVVFTNLMDSLEDAFLARQGISAIRPGVWGERFFAHLEREHGEWTADVVWIYAMAQQMLRRLAMCRRDEGLSSMIYRHPENFLDSVLLLLGKPRSSPN